MIKVGPMVDGVQVAEIIGTLTENETLEFISMINQVFQLNPHPFLVLDIGRLEAIGREGFQAITTAIYRVVDNRGRMVLACKENHSIRKTLESWRSSITFVIYDTASEAVEILKGQVPPISAWTSNQHHNSRQLQVSGFFACEKRLFGLKLT